MDMSSSSLNVKPTNHTTTERTFYGVDYIIEASTASNLGSEALIIEVEEKTTGERWKGVFQSHSIEEITQKGGNYKKFSVFVKLVTTGLLDNSDSVSIDLLSYEDLERMKRKQTQLSGDASAGADSSSGSNRRSTNKRYLILTCKVDSDRVHYPLPLAYQDPSEPQTIKDTMARMRAEIIRLKKDNIDPNLVRSIQSENEALKSKNKLLEETYGKLNQEENRHLRVEYEKIIEENTRLEHQCDSLTHTVSAQTKEMDMMRKKASRRGDVDEDEVRILKNALLQQEDEMQKMAEEHRRDLKVLDKKFKILMEEYEKMQDEEKQYKSRIRNLENEVDTSKRGRGREDRSNGARTRTRSNSNSRNTPKPTSITRFDPTAYIKDKEKKMEEMRGRRTFSSGGSGSRSNSSEPRSRSRTSSVERDNKERGRTSRTGRSSKPASRDSSTERRPPPRSNSRNSREARSRSPGYATLTDSAKQRQSRPPIGPSLEVRDVLRHRPGGARVNIMDHYDDTETPSDSDWKVHRKNKPIIKMARNDAQYSSDDYKKAKKSTLLERLKMLGVDPNETEEDTLDDAESDTSQMAHRRFSENHKGRRELSSSGRVRDLDDDEPRGNGELSTKLAYLQDYLKKRKKGA